MQENSPQLTSALELRNFCSLHQVPKKTNCWEKIKIALQNILLIKITQEIIKQKLLNISINIFKDSNPAYMLNIFGIFDKSCFSEYNVNMSIITIFGNVHL